MINSIKHFEEKSIPVFEKLEGDFYRNPTDVASFVTGLAEELHQLGLLMIKETLENMNLMLKESGKRVQNRVVEKDVEKQLLTSIGMVQYTKTLFTNKKTGEMEYLLDRIMGLEKNTRMTEDAEARLLTEAVQSSYRRGGENASILDSVSKQTVKNKIHHRDFYEILKNLSSLVSAVMNATFPTHTREQILYYIRSIHMRMYADCLTGKQTKCP